MFEPEDSRIYIHMDTMNSIVQCTCNDCGTIQLLCHMVSYLQFPLQLPCYVSLSSL